MMPTTPPTQPNTVAATDRTRRKIRTGIVTSNKMKKTIVVQVSRLARHPQYSRVIRRAASFKVHDEANSAAVGDLVKIMETRPLSKDKRWRLIEILQRASTAPPLPGVGEGSRVKGVGKDRIPSLHPSPVTLDPQAPSDAGATP